MTHPTRRSTPAARPSRTLWQSLAAASLLGASSLALAQPGPRFDKLDSNGDGVIDAGEAEAARAKVFERLDSDGDGAVTRDEITQRRARARQVSDAMLDKVDGDGDGTITRAEFMAQPGMLQRADRDGDGVVSAEEASALREQIRARRSAD